MSAGSGMQADEARAALANASKCLYAAELLADGFGCPKTAVEMADARVALESHVVPLLAALAAAEIERDEVREQHTRVWDAINGPGLPLREDGWRDAEYLEWAVSLGRMVECPSCAFAFGADHTDILGDGSAEGYTCPNCGPESPEAYDAARGRAAAEKTGE